MRERSYKLWTKNVVKQKQKINDGKEEEVEDNIMKKNRKIA